MGRVGVRTGPQAPGASVKRTGGMTGRMFTPEEDAKLVSLLKAACADLPGRSYGSVTTRMETLWKAARDEGRDL